MAQSQTPDEATESTVEQTLADHFTGTFEVTDHGRVVEIDANVAGKHGADVLRHFYDADELRVSYVGGRGSGELSIWVSKVDEFPHTEVDR